MKIAAMVDLALALNAAAASGDYDDVTMTVVRREIESRRIFDTLKVVLGVEVDPGDQIDLLEEWERLAPEPFSDVRPRCGLSALVAYLLAGIRERQGAIC